MLRDAHEDTSPQLLWQWELRDVKVLPKQLRPQAAQHKKLMHKVKLVDSRVDDKLHS